MQMYVTEYYMQLSNSGESIDFHPLLVGKYSLYLCSGHYYSFIPFTVKPITENNYHLREQSKMYGSQLWLCFQRVTLAGSADHDL